MHPQQDHDFDNATLLRILNYLDEPAKSVTLSLLGNLPKFQELRDNVILRTYLKEFLEVDLEILHLRRQIESYSLTQRLFSSIYAEKRQHLDSLLPKRSEYFRRFEMLRRLVCFDNENIIPRIS